MKGIEQMIDYKPSSQKTIFGKFFLKHFLLAIFVLAIFIATSVNLETPHFSNKVITLPYRPHSSISWVLSNNRSESLGQLNPSITSTGSIKVVYELPVKEPVVYITIDDGWYPNENVLKLMRQYHLPITTFLIEQAAQAHPGFWHEFVNAGGHVEDHTFNHPFLTHLPLAEEEKQISQPVNYFCQYGPPPDELRPPYGDFNSQVEQAASKSGIKYIIMWDAEIKNSTLYLRKNQRLKPGDIILLHWVPGLDQEILKLLNIIQKQNLGIADLTQALNGEPVTTSWLKTPIPAPTPVLTTPKVTNAFRNSRYLWSHRYHRHYS